MKTLILGYGFKRQTINLINYGKQLNDIKSLIVKRFNLTILQAHKIIKALNRKGKVIFNNGKVAFMVSIRKEIDVKVNKLILDCKALGKTALHQSVTLNMRSYLTKLLDEIRYHESEYLICDINTNRLQAIKEYFIKVLNY